MNGRSVSFTGNGTDTDGTIASYAWNFGNGKSSTERSPQHEFATAGTFPVTLTVTDDKGATGSVTKQVTTQAAPVPDPGPVPGGVLAADTFGRSVTNGWGNADTGGAWTLRGASSGFSVANGTGRMAMPKGGSNSQATLTGVSSTSTEASIKIAMDKIANGGGVFTSLGLRSTGNNDYRAKVKIAPNGALTLYLVRVINGAETTIVSTNLGAGFNYAMGNTLILKAQANGTTSTALKAKVWKSGQAEPGWQLERTDATPTGLRGAGSPSLTTYLSGTATNTPVTVLYDDLHISSLN